MGDGDDQFIPSLAPEWLKGPSASPKTPSGGASAFGERRPLEWDSNRPARRANGFADHHNHPPLLRSASSDRSSASSWKSSGYVAPGQRPRERDRGPKPGVGVSTSRTALEDRYASLQSPFDSGPPSGRGGAFEGAANGRTAYQPPQRASSVDVGVSLRPTSTSPKPYSERGGLGLAVDAQAPGSAVNASCTSSGGAGVARSSSGAFEREEFPSLGGGAAAAAAAAAARAAAATAAASAAAATAAADAPTLSLSSPGVQGYLAGRSSSGWTSKLADAPAQDGGAAAAPPTSFAVPRVPAAAPALSKAPSLRVVVEGSPADAAAAGPLSAPAAQSSLSNGPLFSTQPPRMADALKQAAAASSASSAAAAGAGAGSSRLEQLAVRQSRTLIPVVAGAKGKGNKPPALQKLEVLSRGGQRQTGSAAAGGGGGAAGGVGGSGAAGAAPLPSPTPLVRLNSSERTLLPLGAPPGQMAWRTQPADAAAKTATPAAAAAAAAAADAPAATPAVLDRQRDRSSFFAVLRRKTTAASSSCAAGAGAGKPPNGTDSVSAAGVGSAVNGGPHAATAGELSAEEEAFLRSLGWTEADADEDDEAGLTEEEIAAFKAAAHQRRGAVASHTPDDGLLVIGGAPAVSTLSALCICNSDLGSSSSEDEA